MDDAEGPTNVKGRVKWFDPTKGFGFVVADGGGPDILLHANVLRNFGQSSVADGAGIEISVQETQRGMQAIEVFVARENDIPRALGPSANSAHI